MKFYYHFLAATLFLLWGCGGPDLPKEVAEAMEDLPKQIDYNLHVKPILSDRCFACHGPDANKRKADLRLDLPEAYDKVSEESGRKALVPGSLAGSEVFHRIISDDPLMVMPSPESNLKLSSKEKAILIKWIRDGAEYKKHWSLVKPEKPEVPEVKDTAWVKTPIDHFILAKLELKGLKPNKAATKERLIRRAYFDLTGLPPNIADVEAFVADKSPEAYEKVIDRLLASRHYGEHMAADWLDAARYADTHGYQDDGYRNSYPWRDWVISAFNDNLPYDKFITWQLAGDLIPKASKEQIIATSFLRNHPQSQEGGIVDEEYRVEYVADRVNVVGKALLAQSFECARCHDHKYDPITQKNYFEMYAFFNNNNETGEVPYAGEASPTLILTTPEVEKILKFIDKEMAPLEQKEQSKEAYQNGFKKWLAQSENNEQRFQLTNNGLLGYHGLNTKLPDGSGRPDRRTRNDYNSTNLKGMLFKGQSSKSFGVIEGRFGKGIRVEGDMGITFARDFPFDRNQPFSFSLWVKTFKPDEKGPLFGKTAGDVNGWRGYMCELNEDQTLSIKLNHVYPANCINLVTSEKLTTGKWHHLAFRYDGTSRAKGVKLFIDGRETALTVINDNLQQSILYARNKANQGGGVRKFMLGREQRGSVSNVGFDEIRIYDRQLSELEIRQLAGNGNMLKELLTKSRRSQQEEQLLFNYYVLAFDEEYARIRKQLIKKRGRKNELLTNQEEVMVYQELPEPRETYILDRGLYDVPTKRVYPNTPESIMEFDESLPKNRLGLAKWLTSEDNPLFARVQVNRLWQQCFGEGLVETPDDFGNQGKFPTHPELLDWMSVNFRENNWDIKKLLKTIVMSAVYRQRSVPRPENKLKDPENMFLSWAPAYRMSAEMIRDNALASSGLLVRKVGGKSVYPYQPDGVWEALAVRNDVKYDQGKGEDLYRRSLYTIWKRSSPPPAMSIFDVPNRYFCTVKRPTTSTPLQALVLMNDPQYMEASRVLGEKMVRKSDNPEEQIDYAFQSLTSRHPRPKEMEILLHLYKEEQAALSKDPARAARLLQVGEYGRDTSLPVLDVATCAMIAHTIMNFDEFIVKR